MPIQLTTKYTSFGMSEKTEERHLGVPLQRTTGVYFHMSRVLGAHRAREEFHFIDVSIQCAWWWN